MDFLNFLLCHKNDLLSKTAPNRQNDSNWRIGSDVYIADGTQPYSAQIRKKIVSSQLERLKVLEIESSKTDTSEYLISAMKFHLNSS